jgi:hypothetical protein
MVMGVGGAAGAAEFYVVESVVSDTMDFDLYPVENLILGPGVGFEENAPHSRLAGGADGLWVTDACGFPCDYIEEFGEPIIELDLGQDVELDEISTWGYSSTNSNGVKEFSLRFATEADGAAGYGSSISYNPTFEMLIADIPRQSFPFDQALTARYVEFTALDNYFEPPGDGSAGEIPGGDRVGLGEISFRIPGTEVPTGPAIEFYPIAGIESDTQDFDLFPVENLIQGPGVGIRAEQPHDKLVGGAAGDWVTDACGFPCDYIDSFGTPILTIDMGEDVALSEIDLWGYATDNSNGVREFSLRFATDAEGPDGFGTSISYNPTFDDVDIDNISRQPFPFSQTVTARYVEFTALDNFFEEPGDGSAGEIPGGDRVGLGEIAFPISGGGQPMLQPGDADMNLEFNQLDLVQVQIAAKYLTGQSATWGEGDWNGGPGGAPNDAPEGDGVFDQLDIIAALNADVYLTGPYAAVAQGGAAGDSQTSVGYNPATGEVFVDAPSGVELTSINIESASGIFTGDAAQNLGGSFDNDADNNIFKATFGGSFGSITFGNVAQAGLSQEVLLGDLTVVGSLAGGGDLGQVDLIYVPEPSAPVLLAFGWLMATFCPRRFR